MEIRTATPTKICRSAQFQFHARLKYLPPPTTTTKRRPRFQGAAISRFSFPTSLSTPTCSLARETASTTNIGAVADPSLGLKKRAADISPQLKGTSIFLVGMKCPMKTNLGKLLADALRYYYFDSDSLVEEAAGGESAAKSVRKSDEKGYLESETEVLKQLSSMGRLVVCAGDGAVQSSTNLALLRHGISLWIDLPPDIVARGIAEDQNQVAHSEVLTQLIATYEEMRGGYATADAIISMQKLAVKLGYDELDCVTAEDMTLEVLKEIEKLTRVKKMMEEAARPF